MLQQNIKYTLGDNLKAIESTSAWSDQNVSCSSCHEYPPGQNCLTPRGRLCGSCALRAIKTRTEHENLAGWTVDQFLKALSPAGQLRWRFVVLWRIKEVQQLILKRNSFDLCKILILVVQNLGYIEPHPLAQDVREAAYNACAALGKIILPLLIKNHETEPWQFRANVVLAAKTIAPENADVRAMVKSAAQDSNPEVRQFLNFGHTGRRYTASKTNAVKPKNNTASNAVSPKDNAAFETQQAESPLTIDPQLLKNKVRSIRSNTALIGPYITAIDLSYNAASLKVIYNRYLYHFFDEADFEIRGNFSAHKLKKAALVRTLAIILADEELFQQFLALLPNDVREILNLLVWEGGEYDVDRLQKMFKAKIQKKKVRSNTLTENINNSYFIFQILNRYQYFFYSGNSYKYYLYLTDDLRKLYKKHLPLPEGADLAALNTIKKTDFVYEDNDQIIRQIRLYFGYIRQGNVKFAKNSDKILKNSLKQMVKYCNIVEFYDNKYNELEYMKTNLIIRFLLKHQYDMPDNSALLVKQLFHDFFSGNDVRSFQLTSLIEHLTGLAYLYDYYYDDRQKNIRKSLHSILRKLPVLRWISIDNVVNYVLYRDVYIEIVDQKNLRNHVYYKEKKWGEADYYSNYERIFISKDRYKEGVIVPFLKATMFLFSAFGIVDIAYNFPGKKNEPSVSHYDGLKYIQLTQLGAYILGLTDNYSVNFEHEEARILLDENRLLINLDGKDLLKTMALEKIGDKISDTCYKVNYSSFLKQCTSKNDILQKIAFFKEQISSNPPQIWKTFLNNIVKKINPLIARQTMAVYKLKQDRELTSLVARDEILKKYILKTENYHIVIASNNVSKVKKRLGEFGYFIDDI